MSGMQVELKCCRNRGGKVACVLHKPKIVGTVRGLCRSLLWGNY